jgi:hypothetical protein
MLSAYFCRGCQTNWSNVPEADGEVGEQYEYCPICRTDEHLEEGREGETFSFNAITGEQVGNSTGLVVEPELPAPPEVNLIEAEGRASWAYMRAYKEGGHEAAERAYNRAIRGSK